MALIYLALAIFFGRVAANSSGPPLSACGSLMPGHPVSTGNKDPVPWDITVTPDLYAPGNTITGNVGILPIRINIF